MQALNAQYTDFFQSNFDTNVIRETQHKYDQINLTLINVSITRQFSTLYKIRLKDKQG